jgi:hypothetical protein
MKSKKSFINKLNKHLSKNEKINVHEFEYIVSDMELSVKNKMGRYL